MCRELMSSPARPSSSAGAGLRCLVWMATAVLLCPAASRSAPCSVPGSHTSVSAAVADAACSEIALGASTFAESVSISRNLALTGAGAGTTVIAGFVAVRDAAQAVLEDLRIDTTSASPEDCRSEALTVEAGAGVEARDLDVVHAFASGCALLFADGFESGDTSAW